MEIDASSALAAFIVNHSSEWSLSPFGEGRIHETWAVTSSAQMEPAYLLQRLNLHVFPDYEGLMQNADVVTRHLASPIGFERTHDGAAFYVDSARGVWRLMRFVPNTRAVPVPASVEQAREAALAYGEFAAGLSTLECDRLVETIPHFHDTPHRVRVLTDAYDHWLRNESSNERSGSSEGHAVEVAYGWLRERDNQAGLVARAIESGALRLRVCHNDAKADNVLVDRDSGRRVCVVDLDTVMPGTPIFDIGDLLRSAAASAGEDEPDDSRVAVKWECAEAIVDGFAQGAGPTLTTTEARMLRSGGWLLALEQAIRYLTDYLEGNRYYRVSYPAQNLDRARNQVALAASFERRGWSP